VDGALSAHAWVIGGETIVTGNLPDLSKYVALPLDAAIYCFPRLNDPIKD
jgi:hypothetical protein